jgi:hypothetical protein
MILVISQNETDYDLERLGTKYQSIIQEVRRPEGVFWQKERKEVETLKMKALSIIELNWIEFIYVP